MDSLGLYPSMPPASPVRTLGQPLSSLAGIGAVCDGVEVTVSPSPGMDIASFAGPRESISHHDRGTTGAAQQEQGLIPQCPGLLPSRTVSAPPPWRYVGDVWAGGFPGDSSGGWQPSLGEGVWGQGCAHQWCFVLLLLHTVVMVAWPRVKAVAGTELQSLVNLGCSLLPSSSAAAGWVPS